MEHVENKREVRKRLRHTRRGPRPNLGFDKSTWIAWFGRNAKYLPLKIHDGDWIAFKILNEAGKSLGRHQSGKWLSCWGSIKNTDYCNAEAKCPNAWGAKQLRNAMVKS